MAGENTLTFQYTASSILGLDLYALVFKPDMSQVFNNTTGLFEAYNPSNRDDYGLPLIEFDVGGDESMYYASNTGAILASTSYPCMLFIQAGASPAAGDTQVGNGTLGPDSGTINQDIAEILARVNAARVVYSGPVSNTLTATIIQGDDYLDADGEALSWTIEDYTGPSVTSATAALKIMLYSGFIAEGGTVALSVTATAAMVGADLVLKADLTAAQTAALEASPPDDKWNYVYQVVVTLSNGHVITPARATGALTVQKRIA